MTYYQDYCKASAECNEALDKLRQALHELLISAAHTLRIDKLLDFLSRLMA